MYNATEAQQIARTIQAQIGSQFIPMIGAYSLASHPEGALSFRFKAKAAKVNGKSPNWVKITLDPMDTYTVEYGRVHGLNFDVLQKDEGVYVEVLRSGIEETLQLRLSMGRVRVAA